MFRPINGDDGPAGGYAPYLLTEPGQGNESGLADTVQVVTEPAGSVYAEYADSAEAPGYLPGANPPNVVAGPVYWFLAGNDGYAVAPGLIVNIARWNSNADPPGAG